MSASEKDSSGLMRGRGGPAHGRAPHGRAPRGPARRSERVHPIIPAFLCGWLLAPSAIGDKTTGGQPAGLDTHVQIPDSQVVIVTPSPDSVRARRDRPRFHDPRVDPIASAWQRWRSEPPLRPRPGPLRSSGKARQPPPWRLPNTIRSRTVFEKFPGNPVLPLGTGASLDAGHAEYPTVVVAGDLLWMYYAAYGSHRRWEIAAAVSLDGIRWTKLGVVLTPDTARAAWDSATIAFPCVIYSEEAPPGERFRMWYAGKRGARYDGIGFATSPDGRDWRREGRVLSAGWKNEWDGGQILDPAVIEVENGYRMYYCGTRPGGGLASIGIAESADGRHWRKLGGNPVYRLDKEDGGIYTVDVIRDGTGYILFASSPKGKREYEMHAVRSPDGLRFDAHGREIVLVPTRDSSWDHALVYGMDVVVQGQMLYMWFNGLYTTNVTRGGQVGLARTTHTALRRLLDHPRTVGRSP